MSTQADFWPLYSEDPLADENTQDLSPESFSKEVEEYELDWHQYQDNFSNFPDNFPVTTTTPPSLTYSTESNYEFAPSQYSYGLGPSEYSIPSELATRSPVEHGVYAIPGTLSSDVVYNDPLSFGPLPHPPGPPLHPAEAYINYGTSDPSPSFFSISPEELSLAIQEPTTIVAPALQSIEVMPDSQTQVTPEKPFRCPQCSYGTSDSYRNLQLTYTS
jgi:hypothetical protein